MEDLVEPRAAVRVLVLGASGFLGSWLVRCLAAAGTDVVCFVRPGSDSWRLRGVDAALAQWPDAQWAEGIAALRPDVIVSLDWDGVAGGRRDDDAQWANLDRQRAVVGAAAAAGVRRFVGVGSQAEYGPKDEPVAEESEPRPRTAYGRAKLAALEQSREACAAAGVEWVWARVFSTFGPLDNAHWLLPLIADALLDNRRIALSSGEQRWSYLYGPDAAEALRVLALSPSAAGVYNLGHPDAPRLRSTIEQFAAYFPSTGELGFGEIPFGRDSVVRLEPDVSRLRGLGWSPAVPLDEALAATAGWLRGDAVEDPFAPGRALPAR